ncbi:hypothetical protein ACP70R_000961 [Stipagrostis hirtigluma subsp. patula]
MISQEKARRHQDHRSPPLSRRRDGDIGGTACRCPQCTPRLVPLCAASRGVYVHPARRAAVRAVPVITHRRALERTTYGHSAAASLSASSVRTGRLDRVVDLRFIARVRIERPVARCSRGRSVGECISSQLCSS